MRTNLSVKPKTIQYQACQLFCSKLVWSKQVVVFIQKQSYSCCYQENKRIRKNHPPYHYVDYIDYDVKGFCFRSFKFYKNSYNKMIQANYQRDDLSFESPSSEEEDHIFVEELNKKRVIDARKQQKNTNHGQVVMRKKQYYYPQKWKAQRYSQTTGYDWLLLYRRKAQLAQARHHKQTSKNKKMAYRQKPHYNSNSLYNSKQFGQSWISQTKSQFINNRFVVHIATQSSKSDFNLNEASKKNTQNNKICQFYVDKYRKQNMQIEEQKNLCENSSQQKKEASKMVLQSILQEKNSSQQTKPLSYTVKNVQSKSTKPKDWQCEVEVINLKLSKKVQKKRQKQKKDQAVIIFNTMDQNQENQFENNLSHCKQQLNQTLNKAFIFGQSFFFQEDQLNQGYATGDLTIKYQGSIRIIKIKSFTLILGDQKVQIKLGRRGPDQKYECNLQRYNKSVQIVQNVFKGNRQYTSSYKQANFKLFLLRLPAKLQSFFEVGPQDLSGLKLQINVVSITCFCRYKFNTYVSLSITCDRCSNLSSLIVEEYSIK